MTTVERIIASVCFFCSGLCLRNVLAGNVAAQLLMAALVLCGSVMAIDGLRREGIILTRRKK